MNVERFAGDNKIMQRMAETMKANEAMMRQRQNEAMANAYEQRARDVQATGVSNAGSFL